MVFVCNMCTNVLSFKVVKLLDLLLWAIFASRTILHGIWYYLQTISCGLKGVLKVFAEFFFGIGCTGTRSVSVATIESAASAEAGGSSPAVSANISAASKIDSQLAYTLVPAGFSGWN